jgi:protein gp37
MALIKSKGNMYTWVTDEWNPVKGKCSHDCSYCYMKRWGKQNPIHLCENEFKTDLGSGKFIFIVSGSDLFAQDVPQEWIDKTLEYCKQFSGNKYLFQSKNPSRINGSLLPENSVVCTTIESNRWYADVMRNSPPPYKRAVGMQCIDLPKYLTIEPILDFDMDEMIEIIKGVNPVQINIGADSGNNHLPEPSKEKLLALIDELKKFTVIDQKRNLTRLLKQTIPCHTNPL